MTNDRKPLGSPGRPAPIITYSRLQPAPRRQQVVDPRRVEPAEPPVSDPAAEQAWDDVDAIPEIRATRHDERPPIPDVDLFVAEPRSRIGRTVAIVAALIILVGVGAFALTSRFGGVAPVPGPTLEAVAPPAADVPDTGDATDAATAADAAAATEATATTDEADTSPAARPVREIPLDGSTAALPAAAPAAAVPEKAPVPRKKPEQTAVAAPDANAPDARALDTKAGVITDGTMRPSTPATASAPAAATAAAPAAKAGDAPGSDADFLAKIEQTLSANRAAAVGNAPVNPTPTVAAAVPPRRPRLRPPPTMGRRGRSDRSRRPSPPARKQLTRRRRNPWASRSSSAVAR